MNMQMFLFGKSISYLVLKNMFLNWGSTILSIPAISILFYKIYFFFMMCIFCNIIPTLQHHRPIYLLPASYLALVIIYGKCYEILKSLPL